MKEISLKKLLQKSKEERLRILKSTLEDTKLRYQFLAYNSIIYYFKEIGVESKRIKELNDEIIEHISTNITNIEKASFFIEGINNPFYEKIKEYTDKKGILSTYKNIIFPTEGRDPFIIVSLLTQSKKSIPTYIDGNYTYKLYQTESKDGYKTAGVLFPKEENSIETTQMIERFFLKSALGCKHFLGLLISAMELPTGNGAFFWNPNRHLRILNISPDKNNKFDSKLKKETTDLIYLLSKLVISKSDTVTENESTIRLLTIEGEDVLIPTDKGQKMKCYILRFPWVDNYNAHVKIPKKILEYDARRERIEIILGTWFYLKSHYDRQKTAEPSYNMDTLLDYTGLNDPKNRTQNGNQIKSAMDKLKEDGLLKTYTIDKNSTGGEKVTPILPDSFHDPIKNDKKGISYKKKQEYKKKKKGGVS